MLNRAKELAYNTIEMPNFLEVKKDTFKNGLNLFYIEGGDLDICHLELIFEAGTKVQSKPLQAALCNAMLLEGTLKSSADEIHNQIDAYGAYTNLDVNADRAIVSLYTLNKYFDTVVPIFINAIKNANFPEKEFTILKEQRRQSFRINSEKVDFTARNTFFGHIYKNHAYGQIALLENFDTIQREDLEAFHALHYKAANFKTYLSGKTPPNAKEILEDLLDDIRVFNNLFSRTICYVNKKTIWYEPSVDECYLNNLINYREHTYIISKRKVLKNKALDVYKYLSNELTKYDKSIIPHQLHNIYEQADEINIELKIEQEKTKQLEVKLQIEKDKTRQLELEIEFYKLKNNL